MSRKLNWLSSVDELEQPALELLQQQMAEYYSSFATRQTYNTLIQVHEEEGPESIITASFLEWFKKQKVKKIVEIGCGNGRIWKKLEELNIGVDVEYTGLEVDENTIKNNKKRWPAQQWFNRSVYSNGLAAGVYDLCFSFYVLEHLVFPLKGLDSMFELLKPGGKLLLVFPDFSVTQRFPSQHLGLGVSRSTKEKIKAGKFIDALVFYYDAQNLSHHLKNLEKHAGKFLVNASPLCLYFGKEKIWPDIDAVYLANKKEIEKWAEGKGAKLEYPFGIQTPFDEHTFVAISKAQQEGQED